MFVDLTDEQKEFQHDLRRYYERLLTPELRRAMAAEEGNGPVRRGIVEQLGADGYIAMGWPEEFGGQGKSAVEQFIFYDESMRFGSPAPMLTINTIGPTIMEFGSDEQKATLLPQIAAGKLHFAIGYSEPDAGTDLFSLTTRAERDGDEYIINGQKTWTSLALGADHLWLAARTNPDVKKHKGISLFIVPVDTPGVTIEPLDLMSSHNCNHTFLDDVHIPASAMIGPENGGYRLITSQLNRERTTLCSSGMVERLLDETATWARETVAADGGLVIDQPWVQRNLAEVTARLEALRLLNWKVAWSISNGELDIAESSSVKVYGTEFYLDAFRLLMQVRGPESLLIDTDRERASTLEMMYRSMLILTYGGGTNEMQRDLVSMFGLGFPRADR